MEIDQLLRGVDCACGRRHACPIRAVHIERGAAGRLGDLLREKRCVTVVSDGNTFAAAGGEVMDALAGKALRRVTFPADRVLIPDEAAVAAVERALDGADAIVGIGSGVIQDLCKYVSFRRAIPYCIVATAPSMDGYASGGAAMILGGMKVTVPAGLPMAILADPAVLKNAPPDMIRAGYGDIVGKLSALNDWQLSRCVNGEFFCRYICDLTMEQVRRTAVLAGGLMAREEESVRTLMEALVTAGILMSFAGSSRPASGAEHHLSHFFEITGILEGRPYLPHGIDVAYSTVVTAALRERLLASPFPRARFRMPEGEKRAELARIYGPSAPGCMALQERAGHYAADRTEVYLAREAELRSILARMPSAQEVSALLAPCGYDMEDFRRFYGEARLRDAVRWAKDLKERYTVLWLNWDLYGGL